MSDILLDVKNLNIVYSTSDGVVYALNDANLHMPAGMTHAMLSLMVCASCLRSFARQLRWPSVGTFQCPLRTIAKKSSKVIVVGVLLQVLINSDTWYMCFLI